MINGVACSPVGKKIAAAGDDGYVRIWNIASGKILFSLGKGVKKSD